jgi:hypothetical protein
VAALVLVAPSGKLSRSDKYKVTSSSSRCRAHRPAWAVLYSEYGAALRGVKRDAGVGWLLERRSVYRLSRRSGVVMGKLGNGLPGVR